tara:strand:- start:21561 stop:22106 length:546 start_codon:yes stop_codon:yes gene_type:complete
MSKHQQKHNEYKQVIKEGARKGVEHAQALLWTLLERNPDKWVVLLGEWCNYAYRGQDNRASWWPALHARRPSWPAPALKMQVRDLDPCVHCLEPTFYGSGRYVNRIPADRPNDLDEAGPNKAMREGYACAECMGRECDHCGNDIAMDEDLKHPETGEGDYHEECLKALGFTDKQIEEGQEI